MLNLVLLTETALEIERQTELSKPKWSNCHFVQDSKGESLYFVDPQSIDCFTSDRLIWKVNLSSPDWVVGLHFSIELDALCIANSSGTFFQIDETENVQEIGEIQSGLLIAKWSPDEIHLLAITQDHHLVLMRAAELEIVSELKIEDIFEKAIPFDETFKAEISWRGDGHFFAVLFGGSSQKHLAIFETSGLKHKATVQTDDLLNGCMAWQPNGRHLYVSSPSKEGSSRILLIETNGLEHGSFDLRTNDKVSSMKWNRDSQLLAVTLEREDHSTLQIWKRSNWHWYLKYERYWKTLQSIHICWDAMVALRMHVFIHRIQCQYIKLEFSMETNVSPNGTAGVIDGHLLLLTPFKHVVIPPPLSVLSIAFESSIQAFAFYSDSKSEKVAILLANNAVALAECPNQDHWEEVECNTMNNGSQLAISSQSLETISLGGGFSKAVHLIWLSETSVAIFNILQSTTHSTTVCKGTLQQGSNGWIWNFSECRSLGFHILRPIGAFEEKLFCQSVTGSVHSIRLSDFQEMERDSDLSFSEPCPTTVVGFIEGKRVILGLNGTGNVYCGTVLIMKNVTSMMQRYDHFGNQVLLTTQRNDKFIARRFDHLLKPTSRLISKQKNEAIAKPLARSGATAGMHAATTPTKVPSSVSLFERDIEQGARLIASPPGTFISFISNRSGKGSVEIVLQMPRGNLETVSLRGFVLQKILLALDRMDFLQAWEMTTMHRLDFNILIDYKWPRFLSSTKEFVSSVQPDDVCTLILSIQSKNVFAEGSNYAFELLSDVPLFSETTETKIDAACSALRSAMEAMDEERFFKPIVLSFARNDPPDLEGALKRIKDLRDKELAQEDFVEISQAGEALKHLLLYIETIDLYNVALGLYDLELAYMVITHAQRDPGEALIGLKRFAEMEPENIRFAEIDRYLHRYSKALQHLVESGSEFLDAAMDLASEQNLFSELMGHVKNDEEKRRKVLAHYGNWLKERGMAEDAAVAYLSAKEFRSAMDAYQSSGEWQMAFVLAKRLKLSEEEMNELAFEVVDELKSLERFEDAAKVILEYLDDPNEAISLMTRARQWKEIVHLCHRLDQVPLLESLVAPSAAAATESYIQEFTRNTESIKKYQKRLDDVREKRKAMEASIGTTGVEMDEEEAASTVGGLSIYTERTKTRQALSSGTEALTVGGKRPIRKKKKSKLKIKQGSPEEEEALVLHLNQLKPNSETMIEVSQLCEFLIFLGFFDDAQKLQSSLDVLIKAHDTTNEEKDSKRTQIRWKWDVLRAPI